MTKEVPIPPTLGEKGSELWKRMTEMWGQMTPFHLSLLETACMAADHMAAAAAEIALHGLFERKGRQHNLHVSPAQRAWNDAAAKYHSCMALLSKDLKIPEKMK